MKTFIGVVHMDEGSAYGVHFPDVPGCHSAADELDELLANASQALALWFEDESAVEAQGMEAVRAHAADDIAAGAFLLAVPLITTASRQVRVNISLDAGMLEAIDIAAAARKLTRSAFVIESARNEIRGRR